MFVSDDEDHKKLTTMEAIFLAMGLCVLVFLVIAVVLVARKKKSRQREDYIEV